jgi:hypothetical protein
MPRLLCRVWSNLWGRRQPLIGLVGNLSYRKNLQLSRKAYTNFKRQVGIRNSPEESRSLPPITHRPISAEVYRRLAE